MIDRSHGGNVWRYPKSSRSAIVDFSVNANPLGMAGKIRDGIARNIDKINYYPDPESENLKKGLAKFHGLSNHNFLIGNGSIELIHLIPRALKAKAVLIPVPTFSEYEFAARANGAKCLFIASRGKNNFKIDIPEVIRHIPEADLVFLCNPNNPTGSILERREILSLLNECKRCNTTMVVDEAFMDFVAPDKRSTMAAESVKTGNLLVLRSLTKFFVVPGLRIGYVVGHNDTINKLARHTYPWNVNTMAQVIAEDAINDKEYITRTRRIVPKEGTYLYENLNRIKGMTVYPSDANFFLCKLTGSGIKGAAELGKKLAKYGILVRNCGNFRGLNDRFFRVAVRIRRENMKLILTLRTILE